jgi:hypothetical protein
VDVVALRHRDWVDRPNRQSVAPARPSGMKLRLPPNNGFMRERPEDRPEHAAYRARVIDADRAAERLVEGLRKNEPWANRLAAFLERATGTTRPACHCDQCAEGLPLRPVGLTEAQTAYTVRPWPEPT